jgi:hypothetical protein
MGVEADFSGYATKAGLKCSDGRIIMPDAFKHMDKMRVPLVWHHGHKEPANVLGHAVLEARDGHVYAHGFFNETEAGRIAKALVVHGDVEALSIYANGLTEKLLRGAKQVIHGMIREVSIVLTGANPGAKIDFVKIQHSDDPDDFTELEDEAVIHNDEPLFEEVDEEEDVEEDEEVEHAADSTVREIYESFTDEQKKVVHFMIGAALEAESAQHSDNDEDDLAHQEGTETNMNVFEKNGTGVSENKRHAVSREDVRTMFRTLVEKGGTLKHVVEEYALSHGITDIDLLFPDAQAITNTPEFDKRRTEWVAGVLNGVKHTPFARVKSLVADLTLDEARAKGYVTGEFKKEEWFGVSKRTTTPTTIYKKQRLDRDDIIDITELDVVAWVKAEMRLMLEEELAGAILIGDGRAVDDEDKVKDPAGVQDGAGIRSILNDHELYAATLNVNINDANSDYNEVVEAVLRGSHLRKGTGAGVFYATRQNIVEMLLSKDTFGRRRWNNRTELAAALEVDAVVDVEIMDRVPDVLGIIVNLADYNLGTNRGGEVNFFDDFNLDYNKYTYLYETRLSGALVAIRAALVIKKVAGTDVLVVPNAPTFVESTGVVTIVATTGVVYKNVDTDATLSTGAQAALDPGETLNVRATPASGYYIANNIEDEWSFTRPAA